MVLIVALSARDITCRPHGTLVPVEAAVSAVEPLTFRNLIVDGAPIKTSQVFGYERRQGPSEMRPITDALCKSQGDIQYVFCFSST